MCSFTLPVQCGPCRSHVPYSLDPFTLSANNAICCWVIVHHSTVDICSSQFVVALRLGTVVLRTGPFITRGKPSLDAPAIALVIGARVPIVVVPSGCILHFSTLSTN